ncbi:hypothetical protein G7046_g329 [Stylonectria norvegica]|nr:hypothetical protein G7046_g329 [Stylonectria norvegica]
MSIPPSLIRVKRKRVDEFPVTFLQFDEGVKRHRTGSNWVYQRRHAGPQSPLAIDAPTNRHVQPVIHVSSHDEDLPQTHKRHAAPAHDATPSSHPPTGRAATGPKQTDGDKLAERRRFHISRKMMMPVPSQHTSGGVSKKVRYGPAVFVERSRARMSQRSARGQDVPPRQTNSEPLGQDAKPADIVTTDNPEEERRLKKPGVKSRSRSPHPESRTQAPLPTSVRRPHNEDMSKITADMNDWVMQEIGANLETMEQEKRHSERPKFKPKAPAKRYQDRHPHVAPGGAHDNEPEPDTAMSDMSDMEDDEDDWVIEEYVRIPAHAMTSDVAPADVGLLVLVTEGDNNLFFGPEHDSDDDLDEDGEDENAENYYTADYPEDEVESDDEFGRQAYGYRNGNASDDEEFDEDDLEAPDDKMVLEGDDDDATMARIKEYMKRSRAFK